MVGLEKDLGQNVMVHLENNNMRGKVLIFTTYSSNQFLFDQITHNYVLFRQKVVSKSISLYHCCLPEKRKINK